jgi:hypothetical protein
MRRACNGDQRIELPFGVQDEQQTVLHSHPHAHTLAARAQRFVSGDRPLRDGAC